MPFLKMLYHWVKLKALTVRYYLSKWDIVYPTECAPLSMTDIKQKALRSRERERCLLKPTTSLTKAVSEVLFLY